MSVRAIEAEVSIKSGISAECTIGREVIVEVHDDVNLETLTATANGSYRPESGVDGWDRVTVAVPERQPITEPLSATANGQYEPSEGIDGFSDVTVNVPERIPVTESLTATENGTYEPDTGVDGYDRVTVSVPPTIPEIEALTVTEDGVYTSSGDGYNPVTVNTGVGALRHEIASAETASGCSPLTEGLTALTTYANEITGESDTNLSDAVRSLADGYGQGGSSTPPWVSSVETVTIEANSVTNTNGVKSYFSDKTPYFAVVLKSAPTTNNQIVAMVNNATSALRYRNGAVGTTAVSTAYDGKLIEGTQYDIYHF